MTENLSMSARKLLETLDQNTKTFLDLQIAYKDIFDKQAYTDHQKLERIASLQVAEKSKWVSVETATALLQKLVTDQTGKEQALRKVWKERPKDSKRSTPDHYEWFEWSQKVEKVFAEDFVTDKSFILVSCKQLSELLDTKRKEWKIAYPLKSQEDFNYRVLIDEIFDELMKVLVVGSGVEPENKKKEP
jgi:adenosyl cobinamide kinase/adenosyl cobinamide phosphate guanylyltransferase